jgi:hypothetical protein
MPRSSHRLRAASTTPSSKTRSISIAKTSGAGDRLTFVEHAVDAANQALQGGPVELVGATEIVHDACLGAFRRGVPGVLGQCLIGDRRTVPILSLRHPQVHAQRVIRRYMPSGQRDMDYRSRGY